MFISVILIIGSFNLKLSVLLISVLDKIVSKSYTIKWSKNGLWPVVSIPYFYNYLNLEQVVSIRYSIQGPYAYQMNQYGIDMVAS